LVTDKVFVRNSLLEFQKTCPKRDTLGQDKLLHSNFSELEEGAPKKEGEL
jgi:hypothetical protein